MARNRLIKKRVNQSRPYPLDPNITYGCLEHRLIWYYLNNSADLPLHHRRSLDQYGYPHLSSIQARDEDQVLHKRTRILDRPAPKDGKTSHIAELWERERRHSKINKIKTSRKDKDVAKQPRKERDSKVLMVDQLWCWVADEGT